jgi:hypothetical protein
MIDLARIFNFNFKYNEKEYEFLTNDFSRLIWLISNIGFKANEFNTVDTYAKKLFLLNDQQGLSDLKKAVSIFFTLWTLTDDKGWKNLNVNKSSLHSRMHKIDPRYINLLATYLERGSSNPKLNENVKFVTWNYDLQLEAAYNKFCLFIENQFYLINKFFPFIPENDNLSVCHLNGFHGFWGLDDFTNLFDRSESKSLKHLIEEFCFIISKGSEDLQFDNYINYAWETDSILAKTARTTAINIFSRTQILVIIGYSFPPFNHVIDKELFENLKGVERIIIQDPCADANFIAETFGIEIGKINVVNNNMEQFVIPNYIENINADYRIRRKN